MVDKGPAAAQPSYVLCSTYFEIVMSDAVNIVNMVQWPWHAACHGPCNFCGVSSVSSWEDFTSLKVLGKGSFGVVHLVRRQGTEEVYALKQIRKDHFRNKNRMKACHNMSKLIYRANVF